MILSTTLSAGTSSAKNSRREMANRIIVQGVEASLDANGDWQSTDEGLRADLEVKAGVNSRGSHTPDRIGAQLNAAVKNLGARILERDAFKQNEEPGTVF